MTDNEIINALECCAERISCDQHCPYWRNSKGCDYVKVKVILDLINSQKAEIEMLNGCVKSEEEVRAIANATIQAGIGIIKAEAVHEFSYRLRAKCGSYDSGHYIFHEDEIDNLVKEMVGEEK